MKLLLDTHLAIWAVSQSARLSLSARAFIEDPSNELYFSVVNIWECTIKYALGHGSFPYEPRKLRNGLLQSGFMELDITSEHALAVSTLAPLHRDPFDRLLIAQASFEEMTLLTVDPQMARYQGQVQLVS